MVCFVLSELILEVVVRFVNVGGIVDHHCIIFLFMAYNSIGYNNDKHFKSIFGGGNVEKRSSILSSFTKNIICTIFETIKKTTRVYSINVYNNHYSLHSVLKHLRYSFKCLNHNEHVHFYLKLSCFCVLVQLVLLSIIRTGYLL